MYRVARVWGGIQRVYMYSHVGAHTWVCVVVHGACMPGSVHACWYV